MAMRLRLGIALAVLLATVVGMRGGRAQAGDGPFPPHRIADNLYYVGSKDLASYLITSDRGHILINSGFAETVPLIREAVEKLGFKFTDVKVLLGSHAHSDHMAGNALVRRLTGASVRVMEGDEEIVRTGGKGDFFYNESWEPCPVDQVLRDGDTVKLGANTLTARKTPGHTRGCTTWTMTAKDQGKEHLVVIIGSPNVNAGYRLVGNQRYASIASDFATTFKVLNSLKCDIFLGAHGNYYNLPEKHARLTAGAKTNPFMDPEGYRAYVANREAAYKAELEKQRIGKE
jgi:metallo-beta-lactamase class B